MNQIKHWLQVMVRQYYITLMKVLDPPTGCAEKIDTTCTFDALKCNCT